jgi:hypothetical protein
VREAEVRSTPKAAAIEAQPRATPPAPAQFVPLQIPATVVKDIRVEVRRGATTVSVT